MGRFGRFLFAALAMLAIAAQPAFAQDEPGVSEVENPNVFLERPYLSPLSPFGKNVILEGQAAAHLYVVNQLTDPVWRREGGRKLAFPITINIVVRIYDDYSSPVRTPSFMVRPLYGQFFTLRRRADSFRLMEFALGLEHHSDGQTGCTFLGTMYDPVTDDCVVTDPDLYALRKANTLDGSFSTNFIPLHFGVRWGELDENALVRRQLSLEGKFEIHPQDFLKGGMSSDLAATYGQLMTGVGVEVEKRRLNKGVVRVQLYEQARFGPDKDNADWSGQLELAYMWYRIEMLGLFARVHWGNDYYNIRFQDTTTFASVGLVWDVGRLDQFVPQRRTRTP